MRKEQIRDRMKQGRETILSARGMMIIALALVIAIIYCSQYGVCGK
jgi:hypothetical protein